MLRWRPFRALIDGQARLSRAFDALLPPLFRVDGMQDFIDSFAPKYIRPGSKVYDVGGGKRPYLSPAQKAGLGIFTVGLDVDRRELERAPAGAYDEVIARDIAGFVGRGDADLVICLAVLEHVRDVEAALGAVSSILRPGGRAIAFVPSRNALYARLNRLLPESLKVKLLAILRDERCDAEGFRAYYDRCTPAEFVRMGRLHGLEVIEMRTYFMAAYFSVFFPLHLAWRLWSLLFRAFVGDQAAESFSVAFEKRP